MKRNILTICFLAALLFFAAGCQGLNTIDKMSFRNLEMIQAPMIEEKNPVLAGALNVLPGIGDAYLGQWGAFVGNLLFWPYSIAWGVPEAAVTAVNINKMETLLHYRFGVGRRWAKERNLDPMTFAPLDVTEIQGFEKIDLREMRDRESQLAAVDARE